LREQGRLLHGGEMAAARPMAGVSRSGSQMLRWMMSAPFPAMSEARFATSQAFDLGPE